MGSVSLRTHDTFFCSSLESASFDHRSLAEGEEDNVDGMDDCSRSYSDSVVCSINNLFLIKLRHESD